MFGLQLVAVVVLSQGGAVYESHRHLSEVDWAGEFYAYGTAVAARKDLTRILTPGSPSRQETARYLLLTSLADDFSNKATLLYALLVLPDRRDERYITAFVKGTESPSFLRLYSGEYFRPLRSEELRELVRLHMKDVQSPSLAQDLDALVMDAGKNRWFHTELNGVLRIAVHAASIDKKARTFAHRIAIVVQGGQGPDIPYLRYLAMILGTY